MSKSNTELPDSKRMTRLSTDSSFVQPAAWPFINHDLRSSADNLHETEAANWMTSRLYNARMIHCNAAAKVTRPAYIRKPQASNEYTQFNSHIHKNSHIIIQQFPKAYFWRCSLTYSNSKNPSVKQKFKVLVVKQQYICNTCCTVYIKIWNTCISTLTVAWWERAE